MSELIQAKLDMPVYRRAFRRERLEEALAFAYSSRLVCLRAGPGFGKTFLIADYLRSRSMPAAWVQVDRADEDPSRLAGYIWAALERVAKSAGCELPRRSSHGNTEATLAQILAGIETLAAQIPRHPLVIVLNDLDLAASQAACALVSQMVEYLPAGATLWVTCRNMPPELALPRWRSLRLAVEIGPEDLALTEHEIAGFCREVLGVEVDQLAANLIYQATSGWISGLILLGDWAQRSRQPIAVAATRVLGRLTSSQGSVTPERDPAIPGAWSSSGPIPLVSDYITDEVLVHQSQPVLRLLSETAILPFVSVDAATSLVDGLTNRDAARLLARIVVEIPLVTRLDHGKIVYHPMLRAALLDGAVAREGEAWLRSRYLAAGRYLRDHGWPEEAVDCFTQGGVAEEAFPLLRRWALHLALHGRVATVASWLDRLPVAVLDTEPRLLAALGCVRQVSGRLDEALDLWQRALDQGGAKARAAAGDDPADAETWYYETTAICRALIADVLAQRGKAQQGLEVLAPGLALPESKVPARFRARMLDALAYCQWLSQDWDRAWQTVDQAGSWYARAGDAFGQATVLNILGGTFHEPRGELRETLACFDRAIALIAPYGITPSRLLYQANRGNILIEMGRAKEAVGELEEVVATGERLGVKRPMMLALLFLSTAYLDLGRVTESRRAGEQCLAMARDMGDKLRIGGAMFVLAMMHRNRGELDMALQLASEDLALMRELGNQHFLLQSLVNVALVRLCRQEHSEAEMVLQEAEQCAAGRVVGLEGVRLYLGLASARFGRDPEGCRAALERCLALAQGRSVEAVLRREAQLAVPLLRWAHAHGIRVAEVEALLESIGPEPRQYPTADAETDLVVVTAAESPAAAAGAHTVGSPLENEPSLPAEALTGLAIRCMGQFAVWVDGHEVRPSLWQKSKALRLFKLLVTNRGRWLPVEQALEALWPEMSPQTALANFRVTLHYARRALASRGASGPARQYLLYERRRCRLNPQLVSWIDFERFEGAMRAAAGRAAAKDATGAAQAYSQAAAYYTGDFLPDDVYEEWAEGPRDSLRTQAVSAYEWLAAHHAAHTRHRAAADELLKAVTIDPYREDLQRELMRQLALDGRVVEALQQYRRCEQALVRELGIGPATETLDLYRQLMNQVTAAGSSGGCL